MNYQKELEKLLNKIGAENIVPSLLLHVCCGPCSTYVLEYLAKYFKITLLFYNPNIDELNEYNKRANEVKKVLEKLKVDFDLIVLDYHPEEFQEIAQGLEKEKEGGLRCHKCYNLRLEGTARYARDKNFDYFTTTLSISPHKNAHVLNQIGKDLEIKYNVAYLYADFKKNDGYKRSIELSKEYELYRQDYCGCIYSREALNADKNN